MIIPNDLLPCTVPDQVGKTEEGWDWELWNLPNNQRLHIIVKCIPGVSSVTKCLLCGPFLSADCYEEVTQNVAYTIRYVEIGRRIAEKKLKELSGE